MADYQIGDKEFAKYKAWLQKEDKAMETRLKYQRDVRSLQKWLRGRAVNQKTYLLSTYTGQGPVLWV